MPWCGHWTVLLYLTIFCSLAFNIQFFFSVIIILFQECVFVLPFLHHLAHLRYILQVPSGFLSIPCLYSLFSVVPDFGSSLSDRHSEMLFCFFIFYFFNTGFVIYCKILQNRQFDTSIQEVWQGCLDTDSELLGDDNTACTKVMNAYTIP